MFDDEGVKLRSGVRLEPCNAAQDMAAQAVEEISYELNE